MKISPRYFIALGFAAGLLCANAVVLASTTTAYMSMEIPEVGESGPDYAEMLIEAFETLDGHDHTAGSGTQIPTAGINENDDHEMNGNSVTEITGLTFSAPSFVPGSNRTLHHSSGNLYWKNASGTDVQITNGGSIVGTPGSITGMTGSASVVYSPLTNAFAFTADDGTPALGDFSTVRVAENVVGGKGPRLKSNAATAADYDFIFPTALPGAVSIATIDASGNLAAAAGAAPAGVQVGFAQTVVTATQTITSQIPFDDTVPQNTEGDQITTVAYTPKKIGNLLEIEVVLQIGDNDGTPGDTTAAVALFKDSAASALATATKALPFATTSDVSGTVTLHYEETVASLSSATWKVRGGSRGAGTAMAVNYGYGDDMGGTMRSYIRVVEIAQ